MFPSLLSFLAFVDKFRSCFLSNSYFVKVIVLISKMSAGAYKVLATSPSIQRHFRKTQPLFKSWATLHWNLARIHNSIKFWDSGILRASEKPLHSDFYESLITVQNSKEIFCKILFANLCFFCTNYFTEKSCEFMLFRGCVLITINDGYQQFHFWKESASTSQNRKVPFLSNLR